MLFGYCFWYEDCEFSSIPIETMKLEIDYAEVSLTHPWPDKLSHDEVQQTLSKLKETKTRFAFHSPLEGLYLYNTRDEIVQAALDIHKKSIKFSAKFNPLYYNFHIKAHPMTLSIKGRDIAHQKCLNAIDDLITIANEQKVRLVIENNSRTSYLLPVEELLQRDIGFNLDVGHWFKGSRGYEDLVSLVERLGNRIELLHIHDVRLDRREDHLSLGDGEIDFIKVFEILKLGNVQWITLETLPSSERVRLVPSNLSRISNILGK